MTTINHPIFRSNNDGDLKLESGEIDASQQFTAQIWKMWEKGKPVGTWLKEKPYYLPGNPPLLQINNKVKGLDNPLVRRAIAFAHRHPQHRQDRDVGLLRRGQRQPDPADRVRGEVLRPGGGRCHRAGSTTRQEAVRILEEDLKATKGSDGIYKLPDGTKLGPWKLITPTGWTDWNTACEVAAKSLKAVGIDVSTEFPQAPQVTAEDAERRLRAGLLERLRREPGQPVVPVPRPDGRPRRRRDRQDDVLQLHPVLRSRRARPARPGRRGGHGRGAARGLPEAGRDLPGEGAGGAR